MNKQIIFIFLIQYHKCEFELGLLKNLICLCTFNFLSTKYNLSDFKRMSKYFFFKLIKTHNFHQLRRSFDPISLTETICFRVHRMLNLNLVYFINQKTNIIINKLKIALLPQNPGCLIVSGVKV